MTNPFNNSAFISFLQLGDLRYRHLSLSKLITVIIIQQIVTMPIYGKEALNICHPYMTDILRYT